MYIDSNGSVIVVAICCRGPADIGTPAALCYQYLLGAVEPAIHVFVYVCGCVYHTTQVSRVDLGLEMFPLPLRILIPPVNANSNSELFPPLTILIRSYLLIGVSAGSWGH